MESTEKYIPTPYQQFIYTSRYARWVEEKGRREYWPETVDRATNFLFKGVEKHFSNKLITKVRNAILNLDVLPSMRLMMTAGEAAERDNICIYNCAYTPIDKPKRLAEILYILMNGTGMGFSVERQEIANMPGVPDRLERSDDATYTVGDSKRGWAEAYLYLIESLYRGTIPKFDYSKVRPAGERLKTFGGRASGPQPLENLFNFTIETFLQASKRASISVDKISRLTSIELHDIVCKIGEIVVVGGVRRSALISLSNLSDNRMRDAKAGEWWNLNPQRALANNSAVYEERPEVGQFMDEWQSLYKSKSGERGIFSRQAAKMLCARIGRDPSYSYGTNPCSEIILRPQEFCNLSEVIVRPEDSYEDIENKVEIATIIGTLQARFTDFQFLSPEWAKNCKEEALLGVSMTGIYDRDLIPAEDLEDLNALARSTNIRVADNIGVTRSAAITAIKPSGTVSQLTDSASGIHPRHSEYYIRSVRGDNKDPITQFLKDRGIPSEPEFLKPDSTTVFYFPIKSPNNCKTRDDIDSISHLETWLHYQKHWCDHKPSVTINVRENEWPKVGAWVWDNFDWMSGVSFLPHDGHSYPQAPYQEIDKEKYEELVKEMPETIDWTLLQDYEKEDNTKGSQELACTAGACEIVDV